MKTADFYFDLPKDLIAQYPLDNRRDSRLLAYDRNTGISEHRQFPDLLHYLRPGDLLVLNNTKVMAARLHGKKITGGKIECLVERVLDEKHALCHIRASKAPVAGSELLFEQGYALTVTGRQGDLFCCELSMGDSLMAMLDAIGHMPLPPYIERADGTEDQTRYQTVFADKIGAVAAPTASLHFDEAMLASIESQGINIAQLTLHVGAGTFQPVRVDDISKHKMHSEWLNVGEDLCDKIQQTKASGGRVIAVGTTVVRSLETAASSGQLQAFCGESDIFITPGFKFNVVDGMLTNFHLPESTLLMLVAAFIGHQQTMALYQQAIEEAYRFFSYGDAMLLL